MDPLFSLKWLRQLWREPEALETLRAQPLPGIAASLSTVLIFALIQTLLWGVVENLFFFFFYPAIVLSVFLAGFRGGIAATLFSSALVAFWFMPHGSQSLLSVQDWLRLGLFTCNGLLISVGIGFLIHRFRELVSRRLQELLSRMEEGFVTLDSNLRFRSANKRALELLRTSEAELLGKNSLNFFPDKDAAVVIEQKMREVRSTGKSSDFEVQLSTYGRWLDFHAYPALHGGVLFFREITEKKQAEERLREKAKEAVEASVKLRRVNLELERSNAELAQFAHIASHDMKEPLRVISNYVELLELQYVSQLDDNAKLFIRFAADGAKRMHALINDILRYSELEAEPPSLQQLDLGAAVSESLHNLAVQVRDSAAKVTVNQLPRLHAPPRQMVQIFQNLISNALKFRRPEAPLTIEIGSRDERDHTLVWVRDNGIGIDESQKEKVFQLFKRIHNRDQYPGSGIGLASCKRIVERLGGKIWFESEPGNGTQFYFTLPKSGVNSTVVPFTPGRWDRVQGAK